VDVRKLTPGRESDSSIPGLINDAFAALESQDDYLLFAGGHLGREMNRG